MPSNLESDVELPGTMEGVWFSSAHSVAYFQLPEKLYVILSMV